MVNSDDPAYFGGYLNTNLIECQIALNLTKEDIKTLVINSGSTAKFLSVMDLDVRDGRVADYRYRLLPIFANLLPPDPQMQVSTDQLDFDFPLTQIGVNCY